MTRIRIGVLTSGGDCPGLNAAIRAVVKSARTRHDMDVVGFRDGYRGLVDDQSAPLDSDDVSNILTEGGTILGSSSREKFFALEDEKSPVPLDLTENAVRTFRKHALDGLVLTGGDGTLKVAQHLQKHGISIIGIPKTIDNDVACTDRAIGFDTAVSFATDAIDRVHSTAESHHRAIVVEVMGKSAGWIALQAGVAAGGDIILIPEIPFLLDEVCQVVESRNRRGRRFSIIVLAEGAGRGHELAAKVAEMTGIECKAVVLGYLQRGGTPTSSDRLLATEMGYAAADLAERKTFGSVTCWQGGGVTPVPLAEVAGKTRRVPPDGLILKVARAVGTSFGDRH